MELGIGAGWYEKEYFAYGYDFLSHRERIRQLEEPAQGSKNKGGRPQNSVWEHFIQTPLATARHFAAECLYCG